MVKKSKQGGERALFSLAIVGRPNVGKSTLFNRLVGKRLALVDDQPGVTRDLREGAARLGPLHFTAIDTAGLENETGDSLPARMRRLTERAVDEADVCLFVIDARAGVTPTDEIFADILRKRATHVVLAANKAEGRAGAAGVAEAYALGLGDPVAISAEHGEGLEDLYDALADIAETMAADYEAAAAEARAGAPQGAAEDEPETDIAVELADLDDDTLAAEDAAPAKIQIAVVGRPNAGKSTLVNKILGEDRLLTGPEAGITRDAIGLDVTWAGQRFRVFDTAGMRKRARVQDKVEKLSVGDSVRAIKFAEVVVLMMDATQPFETQDLRIADLTEREGRAVVFAVNKFDLIENKQRALTELREMADRLLPQLKGAPLVTLSAVDGRGLDRLHAATLSAWRAWNRRVSTAALNRWLAARTQAHPPPAPGGRRIRLRYATQAKARPPSFAVFASRPDELPESYVRYLVNSLRDDFTMPGTPIRVMLRASDNPYKDKPRGKVKKG